MERKEDIMKFNVFSLFITILVLSTLTSLSCSPAVDIEAETAEIQRVVHGSIGWAENKDVDFLFSLLAHDPEFFIFHPSADGTIIGWEAFETLTEQFFMNEDFRATGFEVRDLRINISDSGNVAWFSAILDDFGEWQGVPTAWIDTRWTGVLEKREGNWVIVQMHFSFAADAAEEDDAEADTTDG